MTRLIRDNYAPSESKRWPRNLSDLVKRNILHAKAFWIIFFTESYKEYTITFNKLLGK